MWCERAAPPHMNRDGCRTPPLQMNVKEFFFLKFFEKKKIKFFRKTIEN